jgi:tetratricopeptide (TPR) repeat protein
MADLSLTRGQRAEAAKYAKAALKENPRLAGPLAVLGRVALEERRLDEAIDLFQRALDVNPNLTSAFFGVAYAYQLKGNRDRAIQNYRKVIALAPGDAASYNNLAWLLADAAASHGEALRFAQKALELEPRNGRAMDTLGWVYFKQDKLAEAEKQFRAAGEILPNEAAIQYHLGLVAHRQGRTADASAALKRALLINPNFEDAVTARKLLQELGG